MKRLGMMGLALAFFAVSFPALADTVPHDGFYRGMIFNTSPGSELPERVTLGLNTNVDPAGGALSLSGAVRLYYGNFGTNEFTEQKLSQTNFNVLARQIRLRTTEGLTLALRYVETEGILVGDVYSDALAHVGKIMLLKVRR